MKRNLVLATLVIPSAFAAVVAFHPGVAFAGSNFEGLSAALLQSGTYSTDPAHTSIGFEVEHLGVARVQGRFNNTSGKIKVDPKKIEDSSVTFTIATESIDTGVAPRDHHLRTADFFDVAKYPEIRFASTKIRRDGKRYVAEGDLTIKGTTKRVEIPFTAYGPITDPWGGTRMGMVAEPIRINRQAYGVAYNDKLPNGTSAVGDEVTIRLSLEATLDKPTESN